MLSVNIFYVGFDGVFAQPKFLRNHLIGFSSEQAVKYGGLAWGKDYGALRVGIAALLFCACRHIRRGLLTCEQDYKPAVEQREHRHCDTDDHKRQHGDVCLGYVKMRHGTAGNASQEHTHDVCGQAAAECDCGVARIVEHRSGRAPPEKVKYAASPQHQRVDKEISAHSAPRKHESHEG